jgi:hypothetical protein
MNSHTRVRNSLRLYATGLAIAVTLLFSSTVALGQERSKDRDNPTPLTSNELSDDLDGSNNEYFYKFSAGPGRLAITFEVTASGTNAGAYLDLFDTDSKSILSDVLTQGVDGGTERVVKSVQIGRRRDIVMRIKGIKYGDSGGNGVYKVRLDGAVNFQKADAPEAALSSFVGTWAWVSKKEDKSVTINFKMMQTGSQVAGYYYFPPNETAKAGFNATVSGNTLSFEMPVSSKETMPGKFVMAADGKSFKGNIGPNEVFATLVNP